jgi:hypothetical protein
LLLTDEPLFEVPEFLAQRDVIAVRIDKASDAGIEPVDVFLAETAHLFNGWLAADPPAVLQNFSQERLYF